MHHKLKCQIWVKNLISFWFSGESWEAPKLNINRLTLKMKNVFSTCKD